MTTTTPAAVEAPLSLCVPAALIGVPHLFASTEATRYYLCGISLERLAESCGIVSTATNVHILGAMMSDQGYIAADIILKIEDSAFLRLCRKNAHALTDPPTVWVCAWPGAIRDDGKQPSDSIELLLVTAGSERPNPTFLKDAARHAPNPKLSTGYGVIARAFAEPIDATYPDWRRIIPKMPAPVDGEPYLRPQPVFVQSQYFDTFIAAASALKTSVRIAVPNDHAAPMLVDLARPDFVGVAMPVRTGTEDQPYQRPAWVDIPSQAAAEKAARAFDHPEPEKIAA